MKDIHCVYLNGDYLPPEQAQISAFDRGFVFGDGVYEVIPVYGDRPFRIPHHLQRLNNNLKAIGIDQPLSDSEWKTVLARLISENNHRGGDLSVYLQVSRGVAPRDHAFPEQTPPTVFAYAQHLPATGDALLQQGVSAITLNDDRWQHCDIKSISLLANVLLRQRAKENGVTESILLRSGHVTEGAASNIFVVIDGEMRTPPKSEFILPGITRDLIVELAQQHNVPCREVQITEEELRSAEEIWMTSSTKEVLPITRLDGKLVANGKPGKVIQHMHKLYQHYKQAFREGRVEQDT